MTADLRTLSRLTHAVTASPCGLTLNPARICGINNITFCLISNGFMLVKPHLANSASANCFWLNIVAFQRSFHGTLDHPSRKLHFTPNHLTLQPFSPPINVIHVFDAPDLLTSPCCLNQKGTLCNYSASVIFRASLSLNWTLQSPQLMLWIDFVKLPAAFKHPH